MGRVTVRARSEGREWFGLGMVVSATFDAATGDPRGKVQGFGPLGQRQVKGVEVPVQRNGEDPEIKAMKEISAAFASLDPVTAERVAHWVFDRYTVRADEGEGGHD